MPPPKTSEVWNHFTIVAGKCKCRYCSTSLAHNPKTGTGNLVRHMNRKHKNIPVLRESNLPSTVRNTSSGVNAGNTNTVELGESNNASEISQSTSAPVPIVREEPRTINNGSNSNVITNYTASTRPLPIHRSKQIDNQLIKMIVKEYHPFKIVEDPEFRNLINLLCPAYKIPTRKTVSDSLLAATYDELKEKTKALFKADTAVCLTADGWTSQNNQNHFYAITAHFIDDNTNLHNVLLDCIHYQDRHTADNIAKMLRDVVSEWGLQNNITAIVTDNASNILAAVRILGWRQVRCMAHSLNLAVNNGLKQIEIRPIIMKVKSIVEYFKRSSYALTKLEENEKKMNLPILKLKQDCPTRWNSTFDMLVRFNTLKNAIITTLAIENPELNNLSVIEWEIISKCKEVLHIFQIVTESLSTEKHISLSKVPIYISSIVDKLNESEDSLDCIREIREIIKSEITTRFGDIESQELIAQATLLDPRIKSHGLSPRNAEKAIADLKQICARIKINTDENHNLTNANNDVAHAGQHTTPHTRANQFTEQSLLWGKFDQKVKSLLAPQNAVAASIIEVDKYLNEILLERTQNPLLWWKERQNIYPRLFKVMKKRLCITATSVPCERIFSKMGQIINDRRSRLKPEKTSKIIFLAHNLK